MAYSEPFNNENEKIGENSPLPDLAATIRRLNQEISNYVRATLRGSLDLGDALSWARARVEVRGWKSWRHNHCPDISARWDVLCRQLAASRSIIERALADNPDLSIRDALRLISTPKPHAPKPKVEALEKWRGLSADEIRAGLAADGFDALFEYLPPEWRDQLADRVARVTHKTARDRGLSARLREHIERNPTDRLAKYVRDQAIDPKNLVVHVGAIDAPSKRRPPLMDAQMPAGSAVVH